jgi:DNA transformation protein and related proteins
MDPFTAFCIELLSPLGPVRARPMFGGQGFYIDGLFAALIAGGELYLKVDDETQARFEAAGCKPFTFEMKNGQQTSMRYYRPPEEALESPPLMLPWARLAFEAALRAANAKAKKPAAKRSAASAKPAAKPAVPKSAASAKRAAKLADSESAASAKRAAKLADSESAAKKPATKRSTADRG